MKKKPPVFQDQKTIKEIEKKIYAEHIKSLQKVNIELRNLFLADSLKLKKMF